MPEEFIKFLFERIEEKMEKLENAEDLNDVSLHLDDAETYLAKLKKITLELVESKE